jgi:hypothetical protein
LAVALHYWRHARLNAPIHIQIRLKVRPVRGSEKVSGILGRIFRDDTGQLACGQTLSFDVDCFDEGTVEVGAALLGRQRFALHLEWLSEARVLEAYLAYMDGMYLVQWDQVTALRRYTRVPANPANSEGYGVFAEPIILQRVRDRRSKRPAWWRRVWLGRCAAR